MLNNLTNRVSITSPLIYSSTYIILYLYMLFNFISSFCNDKYWLGTYYTMLAIIDTSSLFLEN